MNQSDIISACIMLHQHLPIKLEYEHVKGHQDENKQFEDLNKMERANVKMDNKAKLTLQMYSRTNNLQFTKQHIPHPYSFADISWNKQPILSEVSTTLYDNIAGQQLHDHWIDKQRYSKATQQTILWEPFS